MKEISAGGVVYRRGADGLEIQMIRDRYGKMTLAKGKLEPGETIEQTALREIREETGILGRLIEPLETIAYDYTHAQLGLVHKEVHYFLVESEEGEHQAQLEEIHSVEWLPPEQAWAMQKNAGYNNNDSVLRRALQALGADLDVVSGADESGDRIQPAQLAPYIDHTLLKADATPEAIIQLCEEARRYGFYSVCVNSGWVPLCIRTLEGSGVRVSAVVGFPLGANASGVKAFEAERAAEAGATEIDMVMQIGALLGGDEAYVREDIRSVVQAVGGRAIVKVILETGLLSDEQKRAACRLAEEAGAHFVKTSTGFGPGGATAADVVLMRESVSPGLSVKASGGIRDRETALAMIAAGANRLGTSAGVAIVAGTESARSFY